MRFARNAFRFAGWYGLAVMLPMFFLEERIGLDLPPAITHPEFFYGFISVTLAWQVAYLVIAEDPARFRPLMIAAILEKGIFGPVAVVLYLQGRMAAPVLAGGVADMLLGVLFAVAYWKTRDTR